MYMPAILAFLGGLVKFYAGLRECRKSVIYVFSTILTTNNEFLMKF